MEHRAAINNKDTNGIFKFEKPNDQTHLKVKRENNH